jgi:hypothetical protein
LSEATDRSARQLSAKATANTTNKPFNSDQSVIKPVISSPHPKPLSVIPSHPAANPPKVGSLNHYQIYSALRSIHAGKLPIDLKKTRVHALFWCKKCNALIWRER